MNVCRLGLVNVESFVACVELHLNPILMALTKKYVGELWSHVFDLIFSSIFDVYPLLVISSIMI